MDPAVRLLMMIYIWLENVNDPEVYKVRESIKEYLNKEGHLNF